MSFETFSAAIDGNESHPQSFVLTPNKNTSGCCSYRKVLEISIAIFACSAIAITVAALVMHYPTVSTAFFTAFGIAAGVSAISISTLSYMLIRSYIKSNANQGHKTTV